MTGTVPPGERGATTVADRAVRRIATRAADEALRPGGGRATGGSARVRGGDARIEVDVALPHPVDVAGVCARVQGQVALRSAELTGLRVDRVGVLVDRLEPTAGARLDTGTGAGLGSGVGTGAGTGVGRGAGTAVDVGAGAGEDGGVGTGPPPVCRRPWSARRVPAAAVALGGALTCAVLLYLAAADALERAAWPGWADGPPEVGPYEGRLIVCWAVSALLGLWLIVLAVTPGSRRRPRMTPPVGEGSRDGADVGVRRDPAAGTCRIAVRATLDRRVVTVALQDAALAVEGVSDARVRTGRRRVAVRASVGFGDLRVAEARLRAALDARTDALGLADPPRVLLSVAADPLWRAPGADGSTAGDDATGDANAADTITAEVSAAEVSAGGAATGGAVADGTGAGGATEGVRGALPEQTGPGEPGGPGEGAGQAGRPGGANGGGTDGR